MTSWHEIGQGISNSSGLLGFPTSALAFDTTTDLLWTGSSLGGLTSLFGPGLQRYTSWVAHTPAHRKQDHVSAGAPQGTRGILCDERAVYSVGDGGIKASIRRGVGRWNLYSAKTEHPSLQLASMCFSPTVASDIIAGGASQSASKTGMLMADDVVIAVNAGTGSVLRKEAAEAQLSLLRRSGRFVCAASTDGHVQLRDPRSLRVQQRLHVHPGGIVDMQAEGDQLYTVGWTMRLGHHVPEPTVKVYDLRAMRALVPIPFAAAGGASLLAVHPKRSSTVIVASASGALQIVDSSNIGEATFHQVNVSSYLTSMAISPSSDFLAFGEADGTVRLWAGSPDAQHFSAFKSNPIEPPDVVDPPPAVNWTTGTSLSKIGMPYYDEQLLSVIPYENYCSDASPLFNPPKRIDPAILASIRTVDKVSYAPLPRSHRGKRNIIQGAGPGGSSARSAARTLDRRRPEDRRRIGEPLFRSEKEAAKRSAKGEDTKNPDSEEDEEESLPADKDSKNRMPAYYKLKTIQYSKFGVEDFDFEFYNKTQYSGLETHIENSYANAYLQALHYLVPFRAVAKAHSLESCPIDPNQPGCMRDNCLLCQAGFLFKMLEDAKGANCQATNFLRCVSASPRAGPLGLTDKEGSASSDVAYSSLIQTFNRFILDTMTTEANESARRPGISEYTNSATNHVSTLFSSTIQTRQVCALCGHETARDSTGRIVDLVYPRKPLSNEAPLPSDFATVLKASLLRETVTKTLCRGCRAPAAPIKSSRVLTSTETFPQALSINCNVNTGEQLRYWTAGTNGKSYLPPAIAIDVGSDGRVTVRELRSTDDIERARQQGSALYALRSMVAQVQAEKDVPHLVAIVKIDKSGDESEERAKEAQSEWHLLNDFLVRPISEEEALSFPAPWKVPAVLIWERFDRSSFDIASLSKQADMTLLSQDITVARNRDPAWQRHTPLEPAEMPLEPGTIIAIDSEFVALNQEELELSSTGTRRLIRPRRLSLARVSVVRGQGPKEGEAFVDDFIWTRDEIVDYLTQFSGIKAGDLDPVTTKYTLVSHKVAYKKLRMLVDLGCVFLGHGLKKDFRIINIYVPPSQVIDTVDLFQSSNHPRKLSLRFLAWFLLKTDIQGPHTVAQPLDASDIVPGEDGSSITTHVETSEGHDSIEDAVAALRLYRLYQTFVRDDRLEDVLEDLYEAGHVYGWKPPPASSAVKSG